MQIPSPIEKIETHWSESASIDLWIKREDLIHPLLSGNKYRKLKYNLARAKLEGKDTILSFGGAYSNHIHALAFACKEHKYKSIGIIRGEQENSNNPTLSDAKQFGMHLHFVNRTEYKNKNTLKYIESLKEIFGDFYLIPEGGTNEYALLGTSEVISEIAFRFDYLCCSVGTGGTIAGLIKSCPNESKILGFSALKGDFIVKEVHDLLCDKYSNWEINTQNHCGGYAKTNNELWDFINEFKEETNIQLDPIYTGKMLLGLKKMSLEGLFPKNSKIIALHTGGLQGLRGFKK